MQPAACELLWGLGTLLINKEESLEEEAIIAKAFFSFWHDVQLERVSSFRLQPRFKTTHGLALRLVLPDC